MNFIGVKVTEIPLHHIHVRSQQRKQLPVFQVTMTKQI